MPGLEVRIPIGAPEVRVMPEEALLAAAATPEVSQADATLGDSKEEASWNDQNVFHHFANKRLRNKIVERGNTKAYSSLTSPNTMTQSASLGLSPQCGPRTLIRIGFRKKPFVVLPRDFAVSKSSFSQGRGGEKELLLLPEAS